MLMIGIMTASLLVGTIGFVIADIDADVALDEDPDGQLTAQDDNFVGTTGLDDILGGGGDDDTVQGGSGNDWITDADGGDFLSGDEGDDVLILGKGDYAIGGEGRDTFMTGIWANGEASIIEDYDPEEENILVSVDAAQPLPVLSIVDDGDDAVVLMDGAPLMVLLGNAGLVQASDITFTTDVFDTRPDDPAL